MRKKTHLAGRPIQYAALPYRRGEDGTGLEVMLVTSRDTRRWVLPKGWPMRGRKGHQAAAREAFEEAGLVGKIGRRRIGAYAYDKRLKDGTAVVCLVRVYPFAVAGQREEWPERDEREARWFSVAQAAQAVHEPGLAALILCFGDKVPAAA